MAATETEVRAQITALVDIAESLRTSYDSAILTKIDTYIQALEGDFAAIGASAMERIRRSMANTIATKVIKPVFDAHLRDYAKALDFAERSPPAILRRIYQNFRDNTKHIKERAFSYGSPSAAGGNVGDGAISRLNIDADGEEIELGLAESFTAEIVADQGSTGMHKEVMLFSTGDQSKDGLEKLGTGQSRQITAISGNDSLLSNPSFTSGTSTSSITDWTVTVGAASSTSKNTTTTYRKSGAGDTATSLALTAAITLQQKIADKNIKLSPSVPYLLQLAYNRSVGSGNGTLTIALGAATVAVTLSVASSGWQILKIALGAAGSWWKGFKENDLDITIALSAGEAISGTTYIDEIILTPMTRFRGQYYAVIGGATPWLLRDSFTWADTIASDSKIQYWIQRLYPGFYLPHNSVPNWADP